MKLYNKSFLLDTIEVLLDNIHDLEKWSAHNEDEYNEVVATLEAITRTLKEKVID